MTRTHTDYAEMVCAILTAIAAWCRAEDVAEGIRRYNLPSAPPTPAETPVAS